jgi:hypothetical protein
MALESNDGFNANIQSAQHPKTNVPTTPSQPKGQETPL